MSTNQLFFALGGLLLTMFGLAMGFLKFYLDAKFEPVNTQLKLLVDYMILHQGKIATLEERTKKL
jgi:hypothetical protein